MSPCGAAISVAPTISSRFPAANRALILSTRFCCAAWEGTAGPAGASQTSPTLVGRASVVLASGLAPARKGLAGGGEAPRQPAANARRHARADGGKTQARRMKLNG